MLEQQARIDLRWVIRIVVDYVGNHRLGVAAVAALISDVHNAFAVLGKPPVPAIEPLVPAVPIRRSVSPEAVVCLECGFRGLMLRRHLNQVHGLSPNQYRQRWGLMPDHPITAPAYSARCAELALEKELGRKPPADDSGSRRAEATHDDLDPTFVASLGRRRPPGRKPQSAPEPAK